MRSKSGAQVRLIFAVLASSIGLLVWFENGADEASTSSTGTPSPRPESRTQALPSLSRNEQEGDGSEERQESQSMAAALRQASPANATLRHGVLSPCGRELLRILRSAGHVPLAEAVGYPAFPFIGVVLETTGDGVVRYELVHPQREAWWRGRNLMGIARSAMHDLRRPALFYFCAHDVDLWTIVGDYGDVYPTVAIVRTELLDLLPRCPSMWFLSWNPSVDPATGQVGPRTVPIPDYHAVRPLTNMHAPPFAQRRLGITWRGVTTGRRSGRFYNESYRDSDRYRAVAALRSNPIADVRFTHRLQGVNSSEVSDDLMGSEQPPIGLLQRRMVLDVDGNANAWTGLRWKLASGSVVVKVASSRGFVQWYYPWLQDKVHLRHVDITREALPAAVEDLSRNLRLCKYLELNARLVAMYVLHPNAARHYLADVIRRIHRWNSTLARRDWRIRPSLEDPLAL